MMRFVCLGVTVSLISLTAGQARAEETDVVQAKSERTAKNAVYVELGGSGLFYSINYERFLADDAAVRLGAMFMSVSASATTSSGTSTANVSLFAAPLMFSYLGIGGSNHKLELGAGAVMMYFSGSGASTFSDAVGRASGFVVAPTATVGYRYVPTNGGFNFKAGFTPFLIAAGGQTTFVPWAGIAAGYGF